MSARDIEFTPEQKRILLTYAHLDLLREAMDKRAAKLQKQVDALRAELDELRHAHKGKWQSGTLYKAGQEVCWQGSSWRAIRLTASEPPSADWVLSAKGYQK